MHALSPLLAAATLVAGTVGFSGSSAADVSAVDGGAFGASVDFFPAEGTPATLEPVPSVTLSSSGDRVSESVTSLTFGDRLLETGTLSVDSHGALGAGGTSTGAAAVADVDALDSFLTATAVTSTCTAAEGNTVAATTLTEASLVGTEADRVALPTGPEPNTVLSSTMAGTGEVVTVILNEQEVVDGSIVVNAVRIVVDGPSGVGEIVLAQSRCAAVATAPSLSDPTVPVDEPVIEPADEPADEPAVEPVTDAADEPAVEPATEPVTEPADDPVDEPVTEPADEPVDEPVTEPADEPEAQAFALPSDDLPAGTLAASATGAPGTGPPANVQANVPGAAATGPAVLATALPVGGAGLFAAQVGEVSGGAFGYSANVSLFGGAQPPAGPAPSVTLPSAGGNETDSAPSGAAVFGPAALFESGALNVSTEGTTGPDGSVTSSASALGVGPGPFTAGEVSSTCTATADGVTASTTIANGVLEGTSSGQVNVPASPGRNTSFEGVVEGANDNFRIVFNEQVVEGNSVTVNAVHMYLLGPTAEGDLIIGQSRCGVGAAAGTGDTSGTAGTGGRSGAGAGSATGAGAGSGSTAGSLADTGGEVPTLLAVALVLAAFTARRGARPRPIAGPDGRG